jgi:hypothetical protein
VPILTVPIQTTVNMPSFDEIERIITEWFAAQPLEIAYAAFQGHEEGAVEIDEPYDLPEFERERILNTTKRGIGLLWLEAARKRAATP